MICGSTRFSATNTVEYMPLEGLVNFDIDWKIITLAMSERAYPVVCTISDSEIAIMGGVKEGGLLKGVFNFNVNTYRVKKE